MWKQKKTRERLNKKIESEEEINVEKFILEHLSAEEILEREDTILQQTLNVCYMGAKPAENIYACLGTYYNGMGPDRFKSKKIYDETIKGKRADMLYYINLENPRDRHSVSMNEVNHFEKENIVIHLNEDLEVRNNFTIVEDKYYKIRAFYLLELIKSD